MTASLYGKYQIPPGQYPEPLNPLGFILGKAELGKPLTNPEWQWLQQRNLAETIKLIKTQESYRDSLTKKIQSELKELRRNKFIYASFKFPTIPSIDSEDALTFYKVSNLEDLSEQESRCVGPDYKSFLNFNRIKHNLGIVEEIPYAKEALSILRKIDLTISLSISDLEWLAENHVPTVLDILSIRFSKLSQKFKTDSHQLAANDLFQHYAILQKLEETAILNDQEMLFLKRNGFLDTFVMAQKHELLKLKEKYQASQVEDDSPTQHLYKVLKKLDLGQVLPEADLNYLRKRKLFKTVKFAFQVDADRLINKVKQGYGLRPDDIIWCKQHDFAEIIFLSLKKDYGIEYRNDTPESPLYAILEKLEAKERLSDENVVWLESEKWCRPSYSETISHWKNNIYIVHHTQEAHFYEAEFQRIKDHWNLVNASAYWRKAEQPDLALKLTRNLDLIRVLKESKLKAALFTTRGGALRDIGQLDDAECCALEAIKNFPKSHNPYTLMGALCYATRRYDEGDTWFDEAVRRGAKPKDQDVEIRRILNKKTGPDRKEMIEDLLVKDPVRFAWVKKLKSAVK
jgi:hypothetical protein